MGAKYFTCFVFILVDKWLLLLTLSVSDVNSNSTVPAEVLLEKKNHCSCSLLWLLSLVLMSFPFFRQLRLGPRQDRLSLSSLAQGHLVPANPAAILFMPVLSPPSYFVRWLLQASLSLASSWCWASVYRSSLGSGFSWTAKVSLVLQTLDVGIPASIKPQKKFFPFSYCFYSTTRVCLHWVFSLVFG